jgi:predicted Rdx family selenoprotein
LYSNRVTSPGDYRTFREIVLHLGWLQQSGQLYINELTFDQLVLDRVSQQPSTGDIVSALGGGLAWKQNADRTFTLSRAIKGRVLISNYDPRILGHAERERLNDIASRNPDNFVLVDIRPEYPGGKFPVFGALKLRSLFAMLDFAGKSIRLFPEFAVDPDPRTRIAICDSEYVPSSPAPRICVRNPVRTLDIEISDVAPPPGDQSIRFQDQYYTVADTRWDRAAFMILYELFQVTVTDVSRIGIPITIAR